uniref:DUF4283 domain-containing protein n=1 Tax=Chenopodium quinoa TaxID=63459 RepID=A0A803LYC1_CHEQI
MWIRLFDIPFNKRCPAFMRDIGDSIGGFIEMDESNPLGWCEFMRMKIVVDVRRPLRRGIFIAGEGNKPKWVDIKLNHTDKECQVKEAEGDFDGEIVYQYESWLRASPLKPSMKSYVVKEKEGVWGEKLGTIRGVGSSSSSNSKLIKLAPFGVARTLHFEATKGAMVDPQPTV